MYTVIIKFYDGNEIVTRFCFVAGNSYQEVLDKMEIYYGVDEIEEITMSPFSPHDFLEFKVEDTDMFYKVKEKLSKEIIW